MLKRIIAIRNYLGKWLLKLIIFLPRTLLAIKSEVADQIWAEHELVFILIPMMDILLAASETPAIGQSLDRNLS